MRLIFISDTHNLHRHYGLDPWGSIPDGDFLIHCGDVTTHGTIEELNTFQTWFAKQPHFYKIWIAGNHDRCLDKPDKPDIWQSARLVYLQESATQLGGLTFWGSPYTPDHQDFAFQLHDQAESHWAKIPSAVDVLITHGPPFAILDKGHGQDHAGCPVLLRHAERVKPRVHAFGHLHESYGRQTEGSTLFINAAVHTWLWKSDTPRDPMIVDL
jgi:Icc-related predicted phosphoesterase